MEVPTLIEGGIHNDSRGTIRFANDFLMDEVKRFYLIHHTNTEAVRAWQAHRLEKKWFYVLEGTFKVVLVKPDDWDSPGMTLPVMEFELKATQNAVLYVPTGLANGFKATQPDSKMIVYTDSYIEAAPKDDLRFPSEYWYDWVALKPKT